VLSWSVLTTSLLVPTTLSTGPFVSLILSLQGTLRLKNLHSLGSVMPKEKSEKSQARKKKNHANKTAKKHQKPRVYTQNVQEKRADSRAKILTSGTVDILEQRYRGRKPGESLLRSFTYCNDSLL
jgi:hypothetical protein